MLAAVLFQYWMVERSSVAADAPVRQPNIIFIMADDLGIGHLGCYGQKKIQTPHIDRLAAEGMQFSQCYSGANVCAPSRSVLMTGLHTGHTPVRNNGLNRHLYDSDVTVAEVLKSAGYATGGFGKWGLGKEDTPGVAVAQGFDEWFGQYDQVHAHFFYPAFLMHNRQRYPLPKNLGKQHAQYAHDEIHAKGLDFIARHAQEPFFCYLPYTLPHVELTVPADSRQPYEDKFPRISRDDPRRGYLGSDHAYAEFAGMVSRLDRSVGEVMALLKKLKLDDNTIVFFTSDNGPQPGAWTDIFVEYFDGNLACRGAKGSFYEGGIRVPLLARWPGKIQAGSKSNLPCVFYDMLPTLAELGKAGAKTATDGNSIAPTLLGQGEQKQHEFLYWEQPAQQGLYQAVRLGDWKGIRQNGKLELYDLDKDVGETTNVIADHSDVGAQIVAIMEREHTTERKYSLEENPQGVNDFVK